MSANLIPILWEATLQTIYMVVVSGLIGTVLGLPLGVFLATSKRGELLSAPAVNAALGLVVNALRSIPFIILVVAIIPFTRLLAGTSIGTTAAIVPLVLAAVLIVFIPTIGDYVTPTLIGGGKIPMVANLIQAQMLDIDNKPLGSAIAVTAMAIVGVLALVFLFLNRRFLKVRQ